ncbi:class I SAM-dependent methyltransferase [Leptodesmis sichuanensis]|uniref:class I SAM-dependent methyltransferase n=1 Tax=Leptodesmis sichuanensis TaxID=2906798 RepID=UPI001F1B4F90|nr:class I SAM-dependent methyltransferase [Leptodesmis sichuanensis]UIE36472.1 class I SAM-dependent methyltransferase [Leptodesmis sichuanensis A121]
MLSSFSVIVPVLNKEKEIIRTLESVEDSIQYFFQHYDGEHPVTAEIVVVNEASSDRTLERILEFAQDKPYCKVVNHGRRVGAGAARNTGVKISQGEVLFFCDGDDLYFKRHIYLCFQLLNHNPTVGTKTSLTLPTDQGSQVIDLPNQPVGVIRTGVFMKEAIHPFWKGAIENTLPQNLCIRRECHEFIEGFPEAAIPYHQTGCEDISYVLWLAKFFKVLKVNLETVEYVRYPGNNFDKQLKKFQTSPEQYQDDTPADIQELHKIRHKIEQDKLAYLVEKLGHIEKTRNFVSLLNWQQLGGEFLAQNKLQEAIALLEPGVELEPTNSAAKTLLAAAYNNLGSTLQGQGKPDAAMPYFQQAIALNPTLAHSDLARIHLNLVAALRDQKQYSQAYAEVQKVLQLDPTLVEAQTEAVKLKYYVEVIHKGYQFSQDWFSINLPIWEHYLQRLANQPELMAVEIGSWEGRSTCWLLDHILTHPTAQITCIDTFTGGAEHQALWQGSFLQTIEQRFDFNVAQTGTPEKVKKIVGKSQIALRSLPLNSYHLAYIDGSHIASDVLEDALLTWGLIKVGGIIIFDDYQYVFPPEVTEAPPKTAIDAFLTTFSKKIVVIHQGYQVLVEKIVP